MLFQLLAVLFTAVSGLFLAFSGRIKAQIAHYRRMQREKRGQREDVKAHSGK
jgi:hypothetical protein